MEDFKKALKKVVEHFIDNYDFSPAQLPITAPVEVEDDCCDEETQTEEIKEEQPIGIPIPTSEGTPYPAWSDKCQYKAYLRCSLFGQRPTKELEALLVGGDEGKNNILKRALNQEHLQILRNNRGKEIQYLPFGNISTVIGEQPTTVKLFSKTEVSKKDNQLSFVFLINYRHREIV